MGNRKEQIANLEREIEQKQQTINDLRKAESKQEPETVSEEQIKRLVDEL